MNHVNLTPQEDLTRIFQEIDNIKKPIQRPVGQIESKVSQLWAGSGLLADPRLKLDKIRQDVGILKKINFSYIKASTGFTDFITRISHAILSISYRVKAYRLQNYFRDQIHYGIDLEEVTRSFKDKLKESRFINQGIQANIDLLNKKINNYLNNLDINKIDIYLFKTATIRLGYIINYCKREKCFFNNAGRFSDSDISKSYDKFVEYLFYLEPTSEE
jgi:hypothetical protein